MIEQVKKYLSLFDKKNHTKTKISFTKFILQAGYSEKK